MMQYNLTDTQLAGILENYQTLQPSAEMYEMMRKVFQTGCNWDVIHVTYKPVPPDNDEN
jgi:hypothetical protein